MRLNEAMLEGFVRRVRRAVKMKGSIDVLVTNSIEMRSLNRRFRGKNAATDVLSFPTLPFGKFGGRRRVGEIAISAEIAAKNAATLGHSAAEEVKILAVHGILHLAGFDHERDRGEMGKAEVTLRKRFRLPTGLIERTARESGNFRTKSASGRNNIRGTA